MNHSLTKFTRIAALALALVLCGPAATARQTPSGSLRGEVVDTLGGLVVGATVTATDAAGVEKTVTTDREGAYVINGLASGTYTVRAAARGFAVYESTTEVTAGRATALNIKLSVTLEKQEVTVSNASAVSTDPENNASAVVLRGADLAALPDDAEELADALDRKSTRLNSSH